MKITVKIGGFAVTLRSCYGHAMVMLWQGDFEEKWVQKQGEGVVIGAATLLIVRDIGRYFEDAAVG